MRQNDSELGLEHDYRVIVGRIQEIVSKVRQSVAMRQIKTPADFIIVMETLRLCGISMAEAGNNLDVPPATVHSWQNGQHLPPASEFQMYAELVSGLLSSHLILFGGRRWGLTSPVAQ